MRGYEDKGALSQAWKETLVDVWTQRAAKMVSSGKPLIMTEQTQKQPLERAVQILSTNSCFLS